MYTECGEGWLPGMDVHRVRKGWIPGRDGHKSDRGLDSR
jgi:hypothetical protein